MNCLEKFLVLTALLMLGSTVFLPILPAYAGGSCTNNCSNDPNICAKDSNPYSVAYSHCCKPGSYGKNTWHNCIDYTIQYYDWGTSYGGVQQCDYSAPGLCDSVDCGPSTDTRVPC